VAGSGVQELVDAAELRSRPIRARLGPAGPRRWRLRRWALLLHGHFDVAGLQSAVEGWNSQLLVLQG